MQPLSLSADWAAVSLERWRRQRRGERQPLSEKLLRPAGHSLQRKLEDLNNAFMTWGMAAFVFSMLVVIFPQTMPTNVFAPFIAVTVFGSVTIVCTVMALRKFYQIRAYRMGLRGEQAMAEALLPLLAQGYQVFHDVPRADKWNIDHVAVGPAGVFAIETKYRTTKPGRNGEQDHKATFDGNRIEFASGNYDGKAVGQARDNARWLTQELSKATDERVAVQPIMALPGWWVTLKANSGVKVLSGKQVAGFITKEPARLADKFVQQISYQLEQRCRDVEF